MTIKQAPTATTADYRALQSGAALQIRPAAGLLVLSDADRSDFLHRMTTNNINALQPGQAAVTVLTSPTARNLFVFTVVCRADELWLLPAAGEAAALSRHLRGQIFFMDKVKVHDASAQYARMRLMGPAAGKVLGELGFPVAAAAGWQEQDGLVAVHQQRYDVPGIELVAPQVRSDELVAALVATDAHLLDDETSYTARRVELGRPAPGHEITGDYNPLEVGLAWACADDKGCYTGQEIIARQVTYDKVTKSLVGLRASELLTAGETVRVDGQAVGAVTSVAYSPTLAAPLALAVVKRPHNVAGSQVTAGSAAAEVVALPFVTP